MKIVSDPSPPGELMVYVGSYTKPHALVPQACGAGITSCVFDSRNGRLTRRAETGGILNPSYLALAETNEHLLAVSENLDAEGAVHAFKCQPDGSLLPAGSQPSGGRATCHVSVLPGEHVCASTYTDGCVAIYPFRDGCLGPRDHLFRYEGQGPNADRQEASHAHQAIVSPDGLRLQVCDLGADRLWSHRLADGQAVPEPPEFASTPPGYGPRHLLFHPALPRAYVICELNAHLLTYDWAPATGRLSLADDLSSLPGDWNGQPAGAAIHMHPNGAVLYVSNRNHDSLVAFRLDRSGRAAFARWIPSGGRTPRDFAIDPAGRWLLCANQNSDRIAIHELDPVTGLPTANAPGIFPVGTPVCVLFAG